MKKWILISLLLLGGIAMHRTEGANSIIDSDGHQVYTEGPPGTTITAAHLNAIQEELCNVVENAGIQLKTQTTDTRDQLWQALSNIGNPYDYVVVSNATFDDAIERVAANQYKFKDIYESIYFRSTEYSMAYVLDGGDVWGYIETNNIKHLDFEMGAYINMGNERGYIEVNTEGCLLNNVSIRGLGTVASAITRSFLLNANYVTFSNCDSQTRLTNSIITVFEGSGTALHNKTSKIIGCKVIDIDSTSGIIGFRYFYNVSNIEIYDLEITAGAGDISCLRDIVNFENCVIEKIDVNTGTLYGFFNCDNGNNLFMHDIDTAGSIWAFNTSYNCTNIYLEDFDGNAIFGLNACTNFNNIFIFDFNATATLCYGVNQSNRISNCEVKQLDATGNCYAYTTSDQLSNCYAEDIDSSGGDSIGYNNCTYLSNCKAYDIDDVAGNSYGYYLCNHVCQSLAEDCANYGFYDSDHLSGCRADTNGSHGYYQCNFIGTSRGISNGSDGFNDCDTVLGSIGNSNTGDGFQNCNHIEHNRASGNGGAAYNNCFADLAATRAAAATDAGGENA